MLRIRDVFSRIRIFPSQFYRICLKDIGSGSATLNSSSLKPEILLQSLGNMMFILDPDSGSKWTRPRIFDPQHWLTIQDFPGKILYVNAQVH